MVERLRAIYMFKLHRPFAPAGDQIQAIEKLTPLLEKGADALTLLGVTGSGKTFTLANVIEKLNRPVLLLSHNKTLAMQLHAELKAFFPENAVEFFISYYDYYLPESYIPQTDTYIAKDSAVNENIEQLRLSTTASLMERKDVIVVASVSCIYGLGSPDDFTYMCLKIQTHMKLDRHTLIRHLIDTQYDRNDAAPEKGEFRVRGDTVDVFLMQRDGFIRISFFGDTVERITHHDQTTSKKLETLDCCVIFPRKHFVIPQERIDGALSSIKQEMIDQICFFKRENKLIEAQRIEQRTLHDLEMMKEIGYCTGIENYSMHLSGRPVGSRPYCLLDFFPDNYLTIIDESHVTIPQVQAMYKADQSRKGVLVEHGFRLPSARENRPLEFEEFLQMTHQTLFVSATPADYELNRSVAVVEQIVRPTGLLDPIIEIYPLDNQIDETIDQVRATTAQKMRTLITTLTKKNAERLAEYLTELKIKACYIHADIDALERSRLLNELRRGDYDCLVGINLLREGIDLPEVGLVCILDADKEGFLRSERSLTQTAGRAARNVNGRVILFADKITPAIQKVMQMTKSRRRVQDAYNKAHNITPKSIEKGVREDVSNYFLRKNKHKNESNKDPIYDLADDQILIELQQDMLTAADALEFERAAMLRDKIKEISKQKRIK